MKKRAQFQDRAGSALLLALWALLLLSAIVLAWVKFINANIRTAAEANFAMEARALAYSGAQVAMHSLVTPQTDALQMPVGNGGYKVTLTGEGGKLNVNWLLDEKDPRKIALLKKYLGLRGLNFQETEIFVDSLLDWVAPAGSKPHPQAVHESDTYHPPHRGGLLSLDEMKEVGGGDALADQPGWSDDLTLWSGDGQAVKPRAPIDLRYASLIVLESLPTSPAITDRVAQRFMEYRSGEDKLDGTPDDPKLTDATAASLLGLTPKQFAAQLNGMTTLSDATWRAVSIGQTRNHSRQVEVVFRKGGAQPQIFLWKEF